MRAQIPTDLHDKWSAELEALLDERDDLDSKRRAISKLLRGELERVADAIARVRLPLKGADPPEKGMRVPGLRSVLPGASGRR